MRFTEQEPLRDGSILLKGCQTICYWLFLVAKNQVYLNGEKLCLGMISINGHGNSNIYVKCLTGFIG
jgi:hypothetical protein